MTRNHMVLTFPSLAENESFARVAVAAFAVQLSPTPVSYTHLGLFLPQRTMHP